MHVGKFSNVECMQLHKKVEQSADCTRKCVTHYNRCLSVTCCGPYGVRHFSVSALSLGVVDCYLIRQVLSAAFQNINISVASYSCVAVKLCSVSWILHKLYLPNFNINI